MLITASTSGRHSIGSTEENRIEAIDCEEDVQRRVRDVFVRISEHVQGGGGRWEVVDADETQEEVQEVVWKAVQDLVVGVDAPLEKLWDDKREATNVETLYM